MLRLQTQRKDPAKQAAKVLCGRKAGAAGREGSKVKVNEGARVGEEGFDNESLSESFLRAFCNIALSKSSDTMRLLTSSWKQTGNAIGEKASLLYIPSLFGTGRKVANVVSRIS
jgi:hypothetical protein